MTKRIALIMGALLCAAAVTMAAPLEWEQICENGFGNLNNYAAFSVAEYEGTIYVGTYNISQGCEIWRFDGPSTSDWTKVSLNGFGNSQNQIPYSMAVYQDKLYVGARNNSANGFEIWYYNGATWSFVTNAISLGDGDLKIPASMLVFDGKLILGTGNSWANNHAKIFSFDGTNWAQINTASFGDSQNRQCRSLCEYDGKLYAGTYNNQGGGQVWEYTGPTVTDWTAVATNGFGEGKNHQDTRSLCAYDGKLYAGTANTTDGCQIWETGNGVDWVRNDPGTNLYFDATRVMIEYGTNLFVGTGNALGAGGNDPGAQVWLYTGGTNWNQINENGFGFTNSAGGHSHMAVQFLHMKNGYLYAGASDSWNNGASVWRTWVGLLPLQPPVASNDVASTPEDMALVINVLTNDTDVDSVSLAILSVTQGSNGTVMISGGGTNTTYTPDADWNGTDNFTYTVGDWYGGFDTGTVEVIVTPVNDAPVVTLIAPTNGSISWVGRTISLTASPSDVDGSVTQVNFFVDGVLIGSAVDIPWQATTMLSNTGEYSMTAKAWDDSATVATSTVVLVAVPADYDADNIADIWEVRYGLSPTNSDDASAAFDSDPFNNLEEYIADTDPTDSNDYFCVSTTSNLPPMTVYFDSSSNRWYGLQGRASLLTGDWALVTGRVGVGGADSMQDTNTAPYRCYRLSVKLQEE